MIRVRFAPSPTGYLHIGGVRTALFNFLYARNQGGTFLLRIEDTDQLRSRPEFEEEILTSMKWLGLVSDEPLVYQSRRVERYREAAAQLLAAGAAYEQEKEGKKAVVFKMPKKKVTLHDIVHGSTDFDASLFDDLVIMKSDGFPTYHFACVVDDHDMQISHVIRGDDHLSNTPRQMLLYEAFGWKPPKYAHLPLIVGNDGSPLSKRDGAMSISYYREQGILPGALLNFLALLGWGADGNQEVFSLEELCKKFSLKKVNKSKAGFNMDKLLWISSQHIKRMNPDAYVEALSAFYPEESKAVSGDRWRKMALLYQTRIRTFAELKTQEPYLFGEVESHDETVFRDLTRQGELFPLLGKWLHEASRVENFDDPSALEAATRQVAETRGCKAGDLIHPLRFMVTGKTVSPGIFELMSALGREKVLSRVRRLLQKEGYQPADVQS